MIEISNENNTFHAKIFEPRKNSDEVEFNQFLDKVIQLESFSLSLSVEGEKIFSNEGRKNLTHWFKTNKENLGNRCLGFARIKEKITSEERTKEKLMKAAMPFPYKIFSNISEAKIWLKEL